MPDEVAYGPFCFGATQHDRRRRGSKQPMAEDVKPTEQKSADGGTVTDPGKPAADGGDDTAALKSAFERTKAELKEL